MNKPDLPIKDIDKRQELLMEDIYCKGLIVQGENRGKRCGNKSREGGYCKKHSLNILIEKAKEEGKRICDDGKRSCKNYTDDRKTKCEECLIKIREKDTEEHNKKRDAGLCLGCGCEITEPVAGLRKSMVQRCEQCYAKLREVESGRGERHRSYKQERKTNITTHYQVYARSAALRNKRFEITIEEFSELVNSRCKYCDYYDETEAIGIDRVDSSDGYVSGNVVPCCGKCNIMKNDIPVDEFIVQITNIYKNYIEPLADDVIPKAAGRDVAPSPKSYIPPKKIIEKYRSGKMEEYIADCVADGRSPSFIDKLRELKDSKFNDVEARAFIKGSLWSETVRNTLDDRCRINKKEMFGYLKLRNVSACVDHYAKVHGTPDGFRNDIQRLVDDWNSVDDSPNEKEFTRILVKYQNKRNA